MSPALRKLSPRDTSAAISAADRLWPGRECAGGGEVVRDLPGGAACSSAGAGEETGDAASTARAVWPGAAIAGGRGAGGVVTSSTGERAASDGVPFVIDSGVAIVALDGWPEMVPRGSTSAGSSPDLGVASNVSCSDE